MVSCEIISAMFCSFSSCARSFALSGLKLVKHPATTGHSTIQVCEGVLLRSARVDLKAVRQGDQQIPFVGRRPSGGEKPGRREQLEAPAGRRQKKRIARKTQRSFSPLGRQKLGRQTQLVPRGYFPRFRQLH